MFRHAALDGANSVKRAKPFHPALKGVDALCAKAREACEFRSHSQRHWLWWHRFRPHAMKLFRRQVGSFKAARLKDWWPVADALLDACRL
jgi:hypothetical protein